MAHVLKKGKRKNIAAPADVHKKWQEVWNTEEYKAKRQKFSANQKSETGGSDSGIPRHCSGSISEFTNQQRMYDRLGRDPHSQELFEAIHKKNGTDEFVDARPRVIHESFLQFKANASQPLERSNEPIDVDEAHLYYEIVDWEKGRRVYGLGSQASAYFPSQASAYCPSSSQSARSVSPVPQQESVNVEFNNLEQRLARIQREKDALSIEIQKMKDMVMTLIAERGLSHQFQLGVPTTDPSQAEHSVAVPPPSPSQHVSDENGSDKDIAPIS